MNLENSIKEVLEKKLTDGTIEKMVEDAIEKGVKEALSSLTGYNGAIKNVVEEKMKETIVPFLNGYDYSKYLITLDMTLTNLLKEISFDNRKILENFKSLTSSEEMKETITVNEIFQEWCKYVGENVETDGLELDYDGEEPNYEYVDVSGEIEEMKKRSWSIYENKKLFLECEHDEKMNFEIMFKQYKDYDCEIDYETKNIDLTSLRSLNSFEVFLLKIKQNGTKIIIDEDYFSDSVTPEEKPEADFR